MSNTVKYIPIFEALKRDILAGKYEHEERFPSLAPLVVRRS